METKSVIISKITLTRPTQATTNLSENDLAILLADKKFTSQHKELTVKVEFQQKREITTQVAVAGRRRSALDISVAMKGHSKVINNDDRMKYAWVNSMNISTMLEMGIAVGVDYGQLTGTVAYLLTEEYSEAEFRNKRIISSPKRKGKNGNILLDEEGNFIFQDTQLVTNAMPDFDGFTYDEFVAFENEAKITYAEELDVTNVPEESKIDGFFNDEFEEWFTEEYAQRNQKVLVSVA